MIDNTKKSSAVMGDKPLLKRLHNLHVDANAKLSVGGVLSVKSYNDKEIILILSEFILLVGGEGLSLDKLNTEDGAVVITGLILSLRYQKTLERGSFIKRLAK